MPGAPASVETAAVLHLPEVDSTNAEAFRLVQRGERGPLWVLADVQTQGRGRSGRAWSSPKGNLHASLLIELACTPAEALQLSLVAGVAAHDALSEVMPPVIVGEFRLKWPNDLMMGTAKLGGILVETAALSQSLVAVVGMGLNLADAPPGLGRAATSLAALGVAPGPADVHPRLARAFDRWRAVWAEGRNFAAIREAWLRRGPAPGSTLSINTGIQRVDGAFQGLGAAGELILRDASGRSQHFTFGDVSLPAAPRTEEGHPHR